MAGRTVGLSSWGVLLIERKQKSGWELLCCPRCRNTRLTIARDDDASPEKYVVDCPLCLWAGNVTELAIVKP